MSETEKHKVGIGISRKVGETWLDAALRYGRRFGMESEIKEAYDGYRATGDSEEEAAWAACLDWDVGSVFKDGIEQNPPQS